VARDGGQVNTNTHEFKKTTEPFTGSKVQGSTFKVKDKEGIEDSISPSSFQVGSKFWIKTEPRTSNLGIFIRVYSRAFAVKSNHGPDRLCTRPPRLAWLAGELAWPAGPPASPERAK